MQYSHTHTQKIGMLVIEKEAFKIVIEWFYSWRKNKETKQYVFIYFQLIKK